MPKKIQPRYYVHLPGTISPDTVAELLIEKNKGDEAEARHLLRWFIVPKGTFVNTRVDSTLNSGVIHLFEFLTKYPQFTTPFYILGVYYQATHTRTLAEFGKANNLRIVLSVSNNDDFLNLYDGFVGHTPYKWSDPSLYLYCKSFWTLSKSEKLCSEEQKSLLVMDAMDKERRTFERLKRRFSNNTGEPVEYKRDSIAEEVRIFVWRRDGGKCVKCGSVDRLEYDHMIPVCKGGGSTARNIQLLCERCNRSKQGKIE